MAIYPEQPLPRTISPLPYIRESIRSQFDGGAISARAKFLRRRVVSLTLTYVERSAFYAQLVDFFTGQAHGVITFEFFYPVPHRIDTITAGAPPTLRTFFPHNYETGDQIYVRNNPAYTDAIHTVTRLNALEVTLDNATVGALSPGGITGRYFLKMRLVGDVVGPYTAIRGPYGGPANNGDRIPISLTIEESW